MRKQPVTAMPTNARAGWQTLTPEQFTHFNGQVQCYQTIRKELELIPSAERPAWLEGFLSMLMSQFKPQEVMKAA
jgi:hypothetical protein